MPQGFLVTYEIAGGILYDSSAIESQFCIPYMYATRDEAFNELRDNAFFPGHSHENNSEFVHTGNDGLRVYFEIKPVNLHRYGILNDMGIIGSANELADAAKILLDYCASKNTHWDYQYCTHRNAYTRQLRRLTASLYDLQDPRNRLSSSSWAS